MNSHSNTKYQACIDAIGTRSPGEEPLTCPHEILKPSIVGAGSDTLSATKVSDGGIAPETLQHDADLRF